MKSFTEFLNEGKTVHVMGGDGFHTVAVHIPRLKPGGKPGRFKTISKHPTHIAAVAAADAYAHANGYERAKTSPEYNAESVIEEGAMDHVTKVIIHTNNNIGDKTSTHAVSVQKDGKSKNFFMGGHPNVGAAKSHAEEIRKAAALGKKDVENWAE